MSGKWAQYEIREDGSLKALVTNPFIVIAVFFFLKIGYIDVIFTATIVLQFEF